MSDALDLRDRDQQFRRLRDTVFDILVVGGGITGAGIARDAALRGYSVALVEAGDFGSGTSSRSTKLIHGGLRYLPQGHVGLVRESARERAILTRIAPHLAQPVPMTVTARSWWERQKLRLGVALFERLGGVPHDQRHTVLNREELEAAEPALNTDRISGAVVYTEYQTDDARLVLGNVRSAAAAGAVVLNYVAADDLQLVSDGPSVVHVAGRLPGEQTATEARARVIVNAAGPWVDPVRRIEDAAADSNLVLTKGIHLVFDQARLPITRAIMLKTPDDRSAFAVPRDGQVYVGTTDTFHDTPETWPGIDAADVNYVLATANLNFDGVGLTPSDIRAAWSGLRPLIADPGKAPSEISRKDEMWTGPGGMITVAGGKLTAYRQMAERAVDACAAHLDGGKVCTSHTGVLPGGGDTPRAVVERLKGAGVAEDAASRLARLYGTEADGILADGGDAAAEVRHAVLNEGALRLADWWYRRSARAWFDPGDNGGALEHGAAEMARLLGWTEEAQAAEVAAVEEQMVRDAAAYAD